MNKKTNLDIVTEIVKEEMTKGPLDRQMKNVILHRVKETLNVSPNNCSVYMAKAIKRLHPVQTKDASVDNQVGV